MLRVIQAACYAVCYLVFGSTITSAQTSADQDAVYRVGRSSDALPGLNRIGVAEPRARGLSLAGAAGYGYTESVLGANDSHHRFLGRVAVSVRPISWFAAALSLDGRFDTHSGDDISDDGLVGDPRLRLRAGTEVSPGLNLGVQAEILFPGAAAPSSSR